MLTLYELEIQLNFPGQFVFGGGEGREGIDADIVLGQKGTNGEFVSQEVEIYIISLLINFSTNADNFLIIIDKEHYQAIITHSVLVFGGDTERDTTPGAEEVGG